MLDVPAFLRLLHWRGKITHHVSDRIIMLSAGYKRLLIDRGADENDIGVIYNWCDEDSVACLNQNEHILRFMPVVPIREVAA
jgi:hypothetical protein